MNLLYQYVRALLTRDELLYYTIPIHFRSYADCVNVELFAKHSFDVINAIFFNLKSPHFAKWEQGDLTFDQFAQARAGYI